MRYVLVEGLGGSGWGEEALCSEPCWWLEVSLGVAIAKCVPRPLSGMDGERVTLSEKSYPSEGMNLCSFISTVGQALPETASL